MESGVVDDTTANFEGFLEGWLLRQEQLLEELHRSTNCDIADQDGIDIDQTSADLIGRVLLHFTEYNEAKSRIIDTNVFLLFQQSWLSSFERTFLWIAGFKPSIAFKLVRRSVSDLSEDQSRRLERLAGEVRAEEDELAANLARVQTSDTASRPLLDLARRWTRAVVNGEVLEEEAAIESLRRSLEVLVEMADSLRGKTVMGVLQILSSGQGVKFLTAALQFQLTVRAWGRRREASLWDRSSH